MKSKILLLCQYYYPEHVSSALLPAQLAQHLAEKGYDVNVITGYPKEYHDGEKVLCKETHKNVNIRRLKYLNFKRINKVFRLINFFSFFTKVFLKLGQIKKYECIFVYSNPPILPLIGYLAKKKDKPKFIFVGFDLYPDNAIAINAIKPKSIISRLMSYINSKVYLNADIIVAISSEMKKYILENYNITDEEKVVNISNWYTGNYKQNVIQCDRENKYIDLRKSYKMIVLYTGNLGEAQDLDTIVQSIIRMSNLKNYDNVLFVFTGHGSRKTEIRITLENNGIQNTKFFGFLKDQDYVDILNIADVCLVSLRKGIEGLGVPSKTYGYFAFGKPIISIMSDGTELAKKIVENKAGFNILQGDVSGFINAIDCFLQNGILLEEYGNNSYRIHSDYYKREIALKKYEAILYQLIHNKFRSKEI